MKRLVLTAILATVIAATSGLASAQSCNGCNSGSYGIWEWLSHDSGSTRSSSCDSQSCSTSCDEYVADSVYNGTGCCEKKSGCGWQFSSFADALFLDRDAPSDLAGTGLVSLNSGAVLLNNNDLNPSIDGGYRVGIYAQQNKCVNYEASFFSSQWDKSRTVAGSNNLNAVLGTLDYTLADTFVVRYDSEIDNFELNRWGSLGDQLSWMVGFRYVSLDEDFNMTALDSGFRSNYLIAADNDLYGGQIGARHQTAMLSDSVLFSLTGKAGVYGNDAKQRVVLGDVNNTVATRNFANEDSATAFVGEIDANLSYCLCDLVDLRVGYQLLWLDQVALAPEQFQQDVVATDAALNNNGSLFANGAYVGMELQW